MTDSGVRVLQDASQGPFDGDDDTLVGVLNQSDKTLGHLELESDSYIFAFDGDGICSGDYGAWIGSEGCPYGSTGYEGPGTEFVDIAPNYMSGVVNFDPGIAPDGTAYFSLEEPITSKTVVSGGPSVVEQGGAPNGSERSTTCGAGDPVNCATGAFWREFTDASIPGRGVPLKFTRTYSSLNAESDGPLGFCWTDSYDMSLEVSSETGTATVHEEGGSTVTFSANGAGEFLAPPRVLATLVKNEDGTYTFSRFSDHIQYVFSEAGQLIREVNRNGNTTTLTYSGGLLEKVTDPSGRSLTFTYEGSHIHTLTDPMGRTTTFSYDAAGDLVGVTNPLGRTWSFTYNAEHLLLSMTDPRGGTTTNTYNFSNQVTAQVDPAGRTTTWAYAGEPTGSAGGATTMTDPREDVTVYDYKNLELMSVTHGSSTPEEATTTYTYEPLTLGVASETNPDGQTTTHTYNPHGDLTSSTDPLGRATYYGYDEMDDLTSVTNLGDTTTTYTYDEHGNLLEKSTPLEGTSEVARTTYRYEAEPGDVTAATDPDGNTTKYTYDSAGDRTRVTDSNGNTTTYAYNTDGELTSTVAPAGNVSGGDPTAHTTSYTYDGDGELTSETDSLGHTTSYAYDGDGNRISVTDADGHTSKQAYNADNGLIEVTRPDGSVLKTEWDASGDMVAQIDGAGHATTYAYDPLGRLIAVTDPDGHTTTYSYDPAGRRTAMVNPEGETTEYGYDADGELTSINYSDGTTPDVTESYSADGERTELTDGSGTSTFTYDSLGRMISTTDGAGATISYGYDLDGHLTSLTYPNGQTVTRAYDAAGNLSSVTDWQGHTTHFTYDADSNLGEEQFPGNVTTQLGYDGADQLTTITDTKEGNTLASFDYTRDPAGLVSSEVANNGTTGTTDYSYDALDQLTSAGEAPYGYDAADNPKTFGAATQTFDPANELRSSSTGSGEVTEHPNEHSGEEPPPSGGGSTQPGPTGGSQPSASGSTSTPRGSVLAFNASSATDGVVNAASTSKPEIVTPKLRTRGAHDLVLAFISAAPGQRALAISGDRLHWSLLAHASGVGGLAEVWQAHATARLAGPITIRLHEHGRPATATIAAFAGQAATVPTVLGHSAAQGRSSAPVDSLTPSAGALLWAVGHSAGQKQPIAPHPGQQLIAQRFDKPARTDSWVQRISASASSSAHVADTRIAGHWTLLVVAIGIPSAQAARATHSSDLGLADHPTSSSTTVGTAIPDPAGDATSSTEHAERRGRANDRVTPSTSAPVTRQFAYNARGDRIEETTSGAAPVPLSYDQADRLIAVGDNITYAYNGDGLRVSKTVNGGTTEFVWNQAEIVPELLQDGSTYYIYGTEGVPLEQITDETPTYLHQDEQSSTRLITDGNGAVVGRYNYAPWGVVTSHTGRITTNLQFDGQYTDAETGFQYLRARYYDPSTGQFVTQDPAFSFTLERYAFSANEPVDQTDPLGLFCIFGHHSNGSCKGGGILHNTVNAVNNALGAVCLVKDLGILCLSLPNNLNLPGSSPGGGQLSDISLPFMPPQIPTLPPLCAPVLPYLEPLSG